MIPHDCNELVTTCSKSHDGAERPLTNGRVTPFIYIITCASAHRGCRWSFRGATDSSLQAVTTGREPARRPVRRWVGLVPPDRSDQFQRRSQEWNYSMTRFTRRRTHSRRRTSDGRANPADSFGDESPRVAGRHRRTGACLSCLPEADAAGAFSDTTGSDSPDYDNARATQRQSVADNPDPHGLSRGGDTWQ